MPIRPIAILLLTVLAACNATPSPGPNGVTGAPTFSGDMDNGDDD
ncbi:hypothetical protein [Jannaschia sp. S6380]|nr:hypothetical protein [Jannaschia sp. S6380]